MGNLLNTVGRDKLLNGMTWKETNEAYQLLQPKQPIDTYDLVIAYLLGIRQGMHNERTRRMGKGGVV